MITGILIGAVGTFVLSYLFLTWLSATNSKRGERMHDELMEWHERSLEALEERNQLTRDTNGLLEAIRDNLK